MNNKYLAGGGVIAAMLASSCCIIPFIIGFIGVGAGTLGYFSIFEKYRTLMIIIALLLLGYSYYKVYWASNHCGSNGACTINPKAQWWNKIILLIFTLVALSFILFPYLVLRLG